MTQHAVRELTRRIFESVGKNDILLLKKYLLSEVNLVQLTFPLKDLVGNVNIDDVNALGIGMVSPLSYAMICQNIEVIDLLISEHKKSEYFQVDLIELSVRIGNDLILEKAISLHESLIKINRNLVGNQFFWAMKFAVYKGEVDMIRKMISAGASAVMVDEKGTTLLMDAGLSNQVEVAKLLIELGTDVSARDRYGQTALDLSALSGNQEVFEYLYSLTPDRKERETAQLKLTSSIQHEQDSSSTIPPEMIDFLSSKNFPW